MTSHTASRFLSLITAATFAALGSAAPPDKPAADPPPDPVALVVAMTTCTPADPKNPPPPLEHNVRNAVTLAKRLAAVGFKVTFVSDTRSEKAVRDGLGEGVTVLAADSDGELDKAWAGWTDAHFKAPKPRPPVGIVVLTGHGEERSADPRKPNTYLLTPKAKEGSGGTRVQTLQQDAVKRGLPLVWLMHMCRTVSTPAPKTPAEDATLTSLTRAQEGRLDPSGGQRPLALWSVGWGAACVDREDDMLATLAAGLTMEKSGKTFAARTEGPTGGPETDLTFSAWFRDAMRKEMDRKENMRPYQMEVGTVPVDMVVASTDPARQRLLMALTRSRKDLLSDWGKAGRPAGDLRAVLTDRGIEVTRPTNAGKNLYITSLLREVHPTKGKTLLVECLALPGEIKPRPDDTLGVLFQPNDGVNEYDDQEDSYASSDWRERKEIPYNRPTLVRIDFDLASDTKRFSKMSFSVDPQRRSSWPVGATLRVTRLELCDTALADELGAPPAAPSLALLPRWWLARGLRTEGSKAVVRVSDGEKGHRAEPSLSAEGGAGELYGWGGAVFPKAWVDPTAHRVEVKLDGIEVPKPATFTVSLFAGETVLGEQKVTLSPDRKAEAVVIELKEAGDISYLSVGTDAARFKGKVTGVAVVNKPNKK